MAFSITPETPKSSSKQSDAFIQALSVQFSRKIRDDAARQKTEEEETFIIEAAVDENTELLVYSIVKQEYMRRIKQRSDFPEEYRPHISDIVDNIEKATRLTPGHIFPLLNKMAEENWNLTLTTNTDVINNDLQIVLINFQACPRLIGSR